MSDEKSNRDLVLDRHTTLVPQGSFSSASLIPSVIVSQGERTQERFVTFFTDNIRNRHTREAYHRNACCFFQWVGKSGLSFPEIKSFHVSAYIEHLLVEKSVPTVKQHLAAIRMLFDWLVIGQVIPANPAHAVRGPRHVVTEGVTPVLDREHVSRLFASFDTTSVIGLRDRAIIGVMAYTFARVEAVVSINLKNYYPQGKKWWLRLHEKNGKVIKMPAHHKLEEYLDEYLEAAQLAEDKKTPLFQSARGRTDQLTGKRIARQSVWQMIRRRIRDAGIETPIGCHSFRGSGITNFLENGGKLEDAQKMAGHSSARTTKLYDRRDDAIKLDEVEKISF